MRRSHIALVVVALLSLGQLSCGHARTAAQAVPPAAPGGAPAASATAGVPLPDDVRWVADSAEYRAAASQAFALASERVEELVQGRSAGSWAVSVDADETVIANTQYEIENARAGTDYAAESWRRWVARREATAVPGARAFLERVHELGGRIVVVTNRKEAERADTEENLRALELPFDVVLARTDEREKEDRWNAVAAGAAGIPATEIVLWVGDNIQDFPDLDQSLRERPEAELAVFGRRFILVPNPMYGSWKE